MKKLLGILLLFQLFFGLISCGSDPGKFNDELMASLNSADAEYSTFYSLVEQFSDSNDFATVSKKGKESLGEMEKRIEKINGVKVPEEGEDFKKACIDYINIMINSMKEFVSEEKLTKSQFEKAIKNMDSNETKLNEVNGRIIETQSSFAQKSGFELKDVPQKK